jgi:ElaB/YqjD/DUF883 family membrane-anchored ribosome-binding protein
MSEATSRYNDNLLALRKDASQMVEDLSTLTEKLAETGQEYSKEVKDQAMAKIEKEMQDLSLRMKAMSEDLKVAAEKVDTHVKSHPYAYILGGVGLGFLLGKIRVSSKN